MYTVVETPTFAADAKEWWSEEEHGAFCAWIAANAEAGVVIPGSGGCRKVRWARNGMGKRGGVRIIYFTRLANGEIWLLVIYAKNVQGSIPAHLLKAIRETIDHEQTH
ncbi:MAG: transcriptional regulator [Moraxellaceae bacterium]|nr:transcriptional regulator [Moraxellaceae bacterium]